MDNLRAQQYGGMGWDKEAGGWGGKGVCVQARTLSATLSIPSLRTRPADSEHAVDVTLPFT